MRSAGTDALFGVGIGAADSALAATGWDSAAGSVASGSSNGSSSESASRATTAPSTTLSPGSAHSRRTTPWRKASTSTLALSVLTTKSGWPASTVSPGWTSHSSRITSSPVAPRSGMMTLEIILPRLLFDE